MGSLQRALCPAVIMGAVKLTCVALVVLVLPQVSFTMLAYPSLISTYFGQASWLMHNSDGHDA